MTLRLDHIESALRRMEAIDVNLAFERMERSFDRMAAAWQQLEADWHRLNESLERQSDGGSEKAKPL